MVLVKEKCRIREWLVIIYLPKIYFDIFLNISKVGFYLCEVLDDLICQSNFYFSHVTFGLKEDKILTDPMVIKFLSEFHIKTTKFSNECLRVIILRILEYIT